MSYHKHTAKVGAQHYLGGDVVPPRLVARVLGARYDGPPGLGDDYKKAVLTSAKSVAAGKGAVPIPLLTQFDHNLAQSMVPLRGLVAASPLSAADKKKLLNTPFTFFFDLFDPIELTVRKAIDRVNAKTGIVVRDFFGVRVDMREPNDHRLDAATLNVVKRLRVIQQFMTLVVLDPINLGLELTGTVFDGLTGNHKVSGLGAYGGGLGVTGADDAAVAGTATVGSEIAAAVGVPALASIIDSIVSGALTLGGTIVTATVTTQLAKAGITAPVNTAVPQTFVPAKAPMITTQGGGVADPTVPTKVSSTIPPLAIAGGFALVAFMFLRR